MLLSEHFLPRVAYSATGVFVEATLTSFILDAVPAAVVFVGMDGSILQANEEACRLLGFSFDALSKRFASDFVLDTIHEDGSPCPHSDYPVVRALATGKKPPPLTIGVRRPDGKLTWGIYSASPQLDATTGKLTGALVTFLDITPQKEAEAALRVSEARLRSILNSAPDVIVMADLEGTILFINRAAPPYKPDQVIGTRIYDYIVPEDCENLRRIVDSVLRTGVVGELESRLRAPLEGRVYSCQIGPVVSCGKTVGITMVTHDITDFRRLQLRLSVADRMASIGQLAAGVAHEINNPLTYVMANIDRAKHELAREEPRLQTLRGPIDSASEGVARIRSVVRELRGFSRTGEDERVLLDLAPILESSIRMAQVDLNCCARVVRSYGPMPVILANEARIGQVFLNLLVNAVQAMAPDPHKNHELRIETSTDPLGQCLVDIFDTGSGIPADMIGRIFDPFVTSKPQGVGSGIGLSISKDIVTALGGNIVVRSEVGVGTTFRVSLPPASVSRRAQSHRTSNATKPITWDRVLRVLVVDDESAIIDAVSSMLEGHTIESAESGRAAIAKLEHTEYDVILCDMRMRNLTGVDVYDHLVREGRGRHSRLLFMTGHAISHNDIAGQRPARILEKPFSAAELGREIQGLLAQSVFSAKGLP